MKKRVTKTPLIKINNSFCHKGVYSYKLHDPFYNIRYLPLGAETIADNLDMSYSTALRICKGEKQLKKSEVMLLQIIHFGLIPDKELIRYKIYFLKGHLLCHNVRKLEMSAGKLSSLYLWESQYLRLEEQLKEARSLIEKLKSELNPPKPEPTNIIKFSDYFKSKG